MTPNLPQSLTSKVVFSGVQGPPGPPGDATSRMLWRQLEMSIAEMDSSVSANQESRNQVQQMLSELQSQYLSTQQAVDSLLLLKDTADFYTVLNWGITSFENQNGWAAYPIEGMSGMELSVSSITAPIQATLVDDTIIDLDIDTDYIRNVGNDDEIILTPKEVA